MYMYTHTRIRQTNAITKIYIKSIMKHKS